MKTNKGFAPIAIFLIIIAILAVGGIAYYAGKNSSKSTPTPNLIPEQNKKTIPVPKPTTSLCPPILGYVDIPNQPPSQITRYIQVLSPNGGEIYNVGDTMKIEWKNCGFLKTRTIEIFLNDNQRNSGEQNFSIAKYIPLGNESFDFRIPATINAYGTTVKIGGQSAYTITISDNSVGAAGTSDTSDLPFTIN